MDASVNTKHSKSITEIKETPSNAEINKFGQWLNLKKPSNYTGPPEIILENSYPLIITCSVQKI
ncbi:Cytoplasmic protein [Eptesipox virus]|uniref:Cytoplasmic protein n=1 Tax=Eptesipox virus TaxID=1329402 RepID=A0A220T687_9POXV|nr:Cytoplasmic protein [Eptesipox virus]ASK51224.1 Cytoplasmic protein [Eptesipox virus]WAH70982.1 cytoplasmic protein [Eptesipox virus]